jgi:hypothetical protein
MLEGSYPRTHSNANPIQVVAGRRYVGEVKVGIAVAPLAWRAKFLRVKMNAEAGNERSEGVFGSR